ncbi:MAG: 3-phosphoshikimate 1-carboxyvinyltransferase [Salinivirgaceae bacterium]|jgi:3-phosphoshikimate 1-carboxyvinyltransferase|nr:3-phosphoshikimate 1-carboxyvinyltransferase [Salinivirgaceae bacterium]
MPTVKYEPAKKAIKTILPGSKSISNRLLMISAIGNFMPSFKNLNKCTDVKTLFNALHSNTNVLDAGESGTALRFLTAYMSGIVGEWHIKGSERLHQRPIKPLVDALKSMGAEIVYDKTMGYAPLTITGTKMKGESVTINISDSSQYASAIILIAPMLEKGLKLRLEGEKRSLPYIDLTINLMEHFGVKVIRMNNEIAIFQGQEYKPCNYKVEADWSAAAYWYQLAALTKDCQIKLLGLNPKSFQGDKALQFIYKKLGVETHQSAQHTTLSRKTESNNSPLTVDLSQTPDLFPSVFLTCVGLQRPLTISGISNLRIKESNRIDACAAIATSMGAETTINEDTICIENYPNPLPKKLIVDVRNDHRIAMAAAILSIVIPEVIINNPDVVEKSYPEFWEEMAKAGISII